MDDAVRASANKQAIEKAREARVKKGTREDGGNLIKLFLYSAFWAAATEVVAGWQVATLATASHCQFIPRTHIFVRFQTWGIPTNRKLLLTVTTRKAKVAE